MLKQYVPRSDRSVALHEPGEVVLARLGNYLEERDTCRPKVRPCIILRSGDCQHLCTGLTTRPEYKTSGDARPRLPRCPTAGLHTSPSFLWSDRPSFICRLDVIKHLGWVDHELVDFLTRYLNLDSLTTGVLWRAATVHTFTPPNLPR